MNEDLMKHGAFGWTELMTTDPEAAKKFYEAIFGWETEKAPMDFVDYTVVKVDGDAVGGLMKLPSEAEGMPPHWSVYVTVDDVDAVAAKVVEAGGKVLRPPDDIPEVGRFCVIQDPQGAVIQAMTYVKK